MTQTAMRQWLGNARDGFGRQTWPDGAGKGSSGWPPFGKGELGNFLRNHLTFFLLLSRELGVETDAKSSWMVCVPLLIGGRISDYFRKVQSTLEIGRTMLCLELRYKEALVVKNQL